MELTLRLPETLPEAVKLVLRTPSCPAWLLGVWLLCPRSGSMSDPTDARGKYARVQRVTHPRGVGRLREMGDGCGEMPRSARTTAS
eukprot:COSAG06_NODE_9435_length_1902_cov_18.130893_1_plen_86_part_00